ncbi:MAG: hypothetical protein AB8B60_02085 [Sulfitobacter sp.]
MIRISAACLWILALANPSKAGAHLSAFPQVADAAQRYIIYVHGRIIESEGTAAVSPRFGPYAYREIIEALAAGQGDVIAPVREGDTDVFAYAETLADQISALVGQGVPPENITIAGFSKGGYVTLLVANKLQNPAIRYVIMAGCVKGVFDGTDANADGLQGSILSMVDRADDLGFSCAPLFARNPQLTRTNDITFDAGTGHGFFYRADPLWIEQVRSWSKLAED